MCELLADKPLTLDYIVYVTASILSRNQFVVTLLVINKIDYLGELALQSILRLTDAPIIVGYLNSADVEELRKFTSLTFFQLDKEAAHIGLDSSGKYQDYENENFFKLVQLKWPLFKHASTVFNAEFVIYSDLDVVWIESPEKYLREVYFENEGVNICIQDATFKGSTKALCMGFVSFRNNSRSQQILEECRKEHAKSLVQNPKSGDDGVITDYFNKLKDKSDFFLLPQLSFPIGLFSNAFGDHSPFSGLTVTQPFIFHANYLVGARRKAIMMIYMLLKFDIHIEIPKGLRLEIFYRRILVPIKRFFR